MVLMIDPWKDIDSTQEFDCLENIFDVKNCDIKLPLSNEIACLSSGSQIKRIYLKPYSKHDTELQKMIIQLEDSI